VKLNLYYSVKCTVPDGTGDQLQTIQTTTENISAFACLRL